MKSISIAVLAISLTTGCSGFVMPEETYRQGSSYAGWVQKCFEAGYLDSGLYNEAKISLSYWTNTWLYDQNKFNSMVAAAYQRTYPNAQGCKETEAATYKLMSTTAPLRNNGQLAYQAQASQQQSQQFFQQQLHQTQQMNNGLMQGLNSTPQFSASSGYQPVRFYTPDECFGSIVNGQCNGTISPAAKTRYCHGTVINGECHGAVTGNQ